jgi:hypothetical protein
VVLKANKGNMQYCGYVNDPIEPKESHHGTPLGLPYSRARGIRRLSRIRDDGPKGIPGVKFPLFLESPFRKLARGNTEKSCGLLPKEFATRAWFSSSEEKRQIG